LIPLFTQGCRDEIATGRVGIDHQNLIPGHPALS
jgi:hypothetical protein